MPDVTYQSEYERVLSAGFIGAGGHSFRNVYPALQYAPVDLRAVCDVDLGRAQSYARTFGAPSAYADHREMLEAERPEIVFIVTGYDADGQVQATRLAADCLRAGSHVWMEKPTAASLDQVRELSELSARTGRLVMTGLKKVFTPTVQKVRQILDTEEFGPVSSLTVRYPQSLPPEHERQDDVAMRGFLDHVFHPAAVLGYLGGAVDRMSYEWEPTSGASVTNLRFSSGVIGSLHLAAGSPATAPLERVEVVGRDASVVIDNGVRLTYYRRGSDHAYGRDDTFVVPDDVAPLTWEPEFSLGQLYNKNLFYLGYVPEILHFCRAVLGEHELALGTLQHVEQIMALYETYRDLPPGAIGHPQERIAALTSDEGAA